jgi:hypothetical protein
MRGGLDALGAPQIRERLDSSAVARAGRDRGVLHDYSLDQLRKRSVPSAEGGVMASRVASIIWPWPLELID